MLYYQPVFLMEIKKTFYQKPEEIGFGVLGAVVVRDGPERGLQGSILALQTQLQEGESRSLQQRDYWVL